MVNATLWTPTQEAFEAALSGLQEEERTRVMRFYFERDRKRALIGRLLLRHLCAKVLRCAQADVRLARTAEGKPFLCNTIPVEFGLPNFNFNLSHHGDWVVVASEPLLLVGCDVSERRMSGRERPVDAMLQELQSCFTSGEWERISTESDDDGKLEQFCRHWTLKESFIKAIGQGLGFELQQADFFVPERTSTGHSPSALRTPPSHLDKVHLIRTDTRVRLRGALAPQWHFEEHNIDRWHAAAVALGPPPAAIPSFRKTLPLYRAGSSVDVCSPLSRSPSHRPDESLRGSSADGAQQEKARERAAAGVYDYEAEYDPASVSCFVELQVNDLLSGV